MAISSAVQAGTILAFDFGTRRIGVAVSDETRTIAQPLEYILAEPFGAFLERCHRIRQPGLRSVGWCGLGYHEFHRVSRRGVVAVVHQ